MMTACDAAEGPKGAQAARAATASYGCTQEDLPAVIIKLDAVPGLNKPVTIEAAGLSEKTPQTLALLQGRRPPGGAAFARAYVEPAPGEAPAFFGGQIELTTFSPGEEAAGHYEFDLPNGDKAKGDFAASWTPGVAACG